jgi:hypothetical protein
MMFLQFVDWLCVTNINRQWYEPFDRVASICVPLHHAHASCIVAGCSVLGSLRPEGPNGKAAADGRLSQYDVFDSLLAAFGNVMLYWFVCECRSKCLGLF